MNARVPMWEIVSRSGRGRRERCRVNAYVWSVGEWTSSAGATLYSESTWLGSGRALPIGYKRRNFRILEGR